MDNLKGIYNRDKKTLEVYYNDEKVLNTEVEYDEDFWHGTNLDGKEVDFHLTNDVNGYSLDFHPDVIVDDSGYLSTNPYISEPVSLIVI